MREAGSDEKSSPKSAALAHSAILHTQYAASTYPTASSSRPSTVLAACTAQSVLRVSACVYARLFVAPAELGGACRSAGGLQVRRYAAPL
jgi:hypothetical protein